MSIEQDYKVRQTRLRRIADRRGLRLTKSGRRDPLAIDYDRFALLDIRTGKYVNPPIADRWVCSWTLDEVEQYLTGGQGEDGEAA
jgi:hypothetical protein